MIDIHFSFDKESITSVEMSGHAESGAYGQDIVCAAVSALSIGTVNSLVEIAGIPIDVVSADKQGGYLKFSLPEHVDDKQMETAQILLSSLLLSLKQTEDEYGEYLTINSSYRK
ncbi:MAG: ribosomal-processing cysteine protease Prp [Alkalibacterium sp.]|nr:ribosomal-processing cysteine protease Prp [Alkalibacterium sp.]TVP92417.1 MAG: ribosomal-processing cysteine protease Prp [Alkalibacterium sp.]